jgi:hypothetical protein
MIETRGSHFLLIQFAAAEYDQPLWLIVTQHDLDEFLPE